MIRNTSEQYGVVSKAFHAVIAVLILGLLLVGVYMTAMEPAPFKYKIYGVHKALGIIVLTLAFMRLVWTIVNIKPKALASHARWEKVLSKAVHILLYGAMFAMPISGWIMSSAGGHTVSIFGWFELPAITAEDKALSGLANKTHMISGYILMGIVGLHIMGALKHQIVDKDSTLQRMFCNRFYRPIGLIAGSAGMVALIMCGLIIFKIILP